VATKIELHTVEKQGNDMVMHQVPSIDVPAGGEVKLMPGSFHVMLFGLTREDIAVIALVARYHRRAIPNPAAHPEYAALDRDSRIAVSKMAALLRVADALDRNHVQHVREFTCTREPGRFIINVAQVEDIGKKPTGKAGRPTPGRSLKVLFTHFRRPPRASSSLKVSTPDFV
jgi:hypothetical protein